MPADKGLMTSAGEINEYIEEYQEAHGGECPPIDTFVSEYPDWLKKKREG